MPARPATPRGRLQRAARALESSRQVARRESQCRTPGCAGRPQTSVLRRSSSLLHRSRRTRRSRVLPDLARGVDDKLQLAPLLVLRQEIALHGRREAALRADGQALQRDVLARLLDSADQVVLLFELRKLAA